MVSENTGSEVMPHWVPPFGLRSPGSSRAITNDNLFHFSFSQINSVSMKIKPQPEDTERHIFGTLEKHQTYCHFPPLFLNSTCVPQDPTPNPKSLGNLRVWPAHSHAITVDCQPLCSHLSVSLSLTNSWHPPSLLTEHCWYSKERRSFGLPHCTSLHKRPAST